MIVNPAKWFGTRELTTPPPHFVRAPTSLTAKSKVWVISKLSGRYSIVEFEDESGFILMGNESVFFEDPAEAMIYELRWSGSK